MCGVCSFFVVVLFFTLSFQHELKCFNYTTEIPCDFPDTVNVLEVKTESKKYENGKFRFLRVLEIVGNSLEEIKIENTKALRTLSITARNKWKEINEDTFGNITKVSKFFFKTESLDFIDKDTFKKIDVSDVYLQDNCIKRIHHDAFPRNSSLISLNCSNNLIESVNFLKNLINLRTLYLSSNNISSISPDITKEFMHLQIFYIDNNKITQLNFLQNLPSLLKIFINRNKIETIPLNILTQSIQLIELNLSDNLIKTIGTGTFVDKPKLKFLDLSNNQLEVVGEIFHSFKSPIVNLNNNSLTHINLEDAHLTLFIDDNKWDCQYLRELFTFNNITFKYTSNNTIPNVNGAKCINSTNYNINITTNNNLMEIFYVVALIGIDVMLLIVFTLSVKICISRENNKENGSEVAGDIIMSTLDESGYSVPRNGYQACNIYNEIVPTVEVNQENTYYINTE
ncbi:carboxypeptidase N subunit 2-like isoform X2 [Onthophagus taurus]|uniref:carboxypeptidase N subunit 2-like isoform X2 n=1 Tax=Onthophagus taurus TaxID=166361 RepID=UPI0039BDDACD